jgi:hypothetical protein
MFFPEKWPFFNGGGNDVTSNPALQSQPTSAIGSGRFWLKIDRFFAKLSQIFIILAIFRRFDLNRTRELVLRAIFWMRSQPFAACLTGPDCAGWSFPLGG